MKLGPHMTSLINFIRSKAGVLSWQHTHVSNLMPSYLWMSASATDFSWQMFFTTYDIIFHASSTVKCQTIIFFILRMCLLTSVILFCHSQLVLNTIWILSGYYHTLSGYYQAVWMYCYTIKIANTKLQNKNNQTKPTWILLENCCCFMTVE